MEHIKFSAIIALLLAVVSTSSANSACSVRASSPEQCSKANSWLDKVKYGNFYQSRSQADQGKVHSGDHILNISFS